MKHFASKLSLIYVLFLSAVTFQISSCSSDDDQPEGPQITGISPESGAEGTIVTISGKGFDKIAANNSVKFNGAVATVQTASETQIVVRAPAGGSTGNVTVAIGATELTGPVFTYTEPQPAETYYVRFKADGNVRIFETSNPGYSACGDCSCSYIPPLDETNYAGIEICQAGEVTAAMIQALKNQTLSFGSGSPRPSLWININGESYSTESIDQPSGSKMVVNDVVADGTFATAKAFKVTGTFSGKIAKNGGGSPLTITEGTFVVRFTEEY